MIVYYRHGEIDRGLWDNCIKNSAVTKPYAYSWYLDRMAPGWEALVDDDYDSVFPVPSYVRFGVQYASTPPFLQQLGAFSPDKPASDAIVEFLDYMPEIYKLTDLCVGQKVDYPGYKVIEKTNFELNLSSHYERLLDRYTPECRKYISNAAKKRYEITGNITTEELADLCISNKKSNIKGIKLRDYDRLIDFMNYCIRNGKGRIAGVRATRKRVVYGIFLVQIPGSITILLEANTAASIEKHIGYFVINEIIKENASTAAILDFAGASDNLAVPKGLSFGGINVPFYRIYRNRLFWPVRIMKE
jgi:hypothetical protein